MGSSIPAPNFQWVGQQLNSGASRLGGHQMNGDNSAPGFDDAGTADAGTHDAALYFAYSATLRIFATDLDLDFVTATLGFEPTSTFRVGQNRTPVSTPSKHNAWHLASGLPEEEPLAAHIDALWQRLRPIQKQVFELKTRATIDVFLGYRSNCDHAGFEIPAASLEMFTSLDIPFEVSVIIA